MKKLKLFYYLTIVCLITGTTFHLSTYLPNLRIGSTSMIVTLIIATLITFFLAIKSTKDPSGPTSKDIKESMKSMFNRVPKWMKTVSIILVIYVFFNFFYSLMILNKGGATPDIKNGQYVLMNKSKVREVITEEQYYKHKAYTYRAMSGHFLMFQMITLIMLTSAIAIKKDESTT